MFGVKILSVVSSFQLLWTLWANTLCSKHQGDTSIRRFPNLGMLWRDKCAIVSQRKNPALRANSPPSENNQSDAKDTIWKLFFEADVQDNSTFDLHGGRKHLRNLRSRRTQLWGHCANVRVAYWTIFSSLLEAHILPISDWNCKLELFSFIEGLNVCPTLSSATSHTRKTGPSKSEFHIWSSINVEFNAFSSSLQTENQAKLQLYNEPFRKHSAFRHSRRLEFSPETNSWQSMIGTAFLFRNQPKLVKF